MQKRLTFAKVTGTAWQRVHVLEGYAHLDPLTAADNEAVPLILGFLNEVLGFPIE